MADDEIKVKGMGAAMAQAEAGLALFKEEKEPELDTAAATAFKDEMDAKIAELDAAVAALTGKDNKKARTEKEKGKKALKDQKDYIDACKVVKGLQPPNGHFIKQAAGPSEAEKAKAAKEAEAKAAEEAKKKAEEDAKAAKASKDKPKKEMESAGISKAERDELEKLKNDIINKKQALKEQGMSGGQMNKDEEIVAWVARMNELKEKECPGALQAAKDEKKGGKKKKVLDSEQSAILEEKERLFAEYTDKLRNEFKYSKKEIAADPDYADMKLEIEKMKK